MFDLIIRNGTVINEDAIRNCDIGITDGKITFLGEIDAGTEAKKEIDASGMEVYPGMIDSHVHVNLKLGEFTTLDSFENASLAAAHGGTTTLIDFAIPYGEESPVDAVLRRQEEAAESCHVNYSFHACFKENSIRHLGEIEQLMDMGIPSIKMFTVYDDVVRINKGAILDILGRISKVGGLALFHAENNDIILNEIRKCQEAETLSAYYHAVSRPGIAEKEEVASLLALVEETGTPALFVHQSTPAIRELLDHYKINKGLPVFSEVCTHYLSLDETVYQNDNGHWYICSPPIRSKKDQQGLWSLLEGGYVDMVNSDHCCYSIEQKDKYQHDFTGAPNGLPGVETRGIILYSEAVIDRKIDRKKFAALTSTNVAKVMGMYPEKGKIDVGCDADISIIDPTSITKITSEHLHMHTNYTPFEGKKLTGKIAHTIVNGKHVIDKGEMTSNTHAGNFIKRRSPIMSERDV